LELAGDEPGTEERDLGNSYVSAKKGKSYGPIQSSSVSGPVAAMGSLARCLVNCDVSGGAPFMGWTIWSALWHFGTQEELHSGA